MQLSLNQQYELAKMKWDKAQRNYKVGNISVDELNDIANEITRLQFELIKELKDEIKSLGGEPCV